MNKRIYFSFLLIFIIQLGACSQSTTTTPTTIEGGSGAAPLPPQEIPLTGALTHLVDIPDGTSPITVSSIKEVDTQVKGEFSLNNILNDTYPFSSKLSAGQGEEMCVFATMYAKSLALMAESGDYVMCSLKQMQNTLEDRLADFYERDHENIFSYQQGDHFYKIKMIFDSFGSGNTIANINGLDLYICKGTSENNLEQIGYTHYERKPVNSTQESYLVATKKKDLQGNIQSVKIFGRINALLQLVDKKMIDFNWYHTWDNNDGGIEHAKFTIMQGYKNISMTGYVSQETSDTHSSWQLSGIGGLAQGELKDYVFNKIKLGNIALNYAKNLGSPDLVYIDGETLNKESSPNEFYRSTSINPVPSVLTAKPLTFNHAEEWDCSGLATEIDIANIPIETKCAKYKVNNLYHPIQCEVLATSVTHEDDSNDRRYIPTPPTKR